MAIGKHAGAMGLSKRVRNSGYTLRGQKLKSSQKYEEVSVFSISHGNGCTHVAITVANYIAVRHPKEEIALVSDENERFIEEFKEKNVVQVRSSDNTLFRYRYKVYDHGMIKEQDFKEKALPGRRLMILPYHHDRFYTLELFTRLCPVAKDVVYLFNRVPAKREREIGDIMCAYSYNFMPLYDITNTRDINGLMALYI